MQSLTKTEEIILAAIWRLQPNAYGVAISETINKTTGLNWKFGSIYTPLSRLVKKGLLTASDGEPTPERGGRYKIYFELTRSGKKALRRAVQINHAVFDLPALDIE